MDGSRQDGKAAARGSDLRFIARGFGTYRKDAVLAGLCVFVETSLELLIPFLMSSVIDEGISGASPYVVWTRGTAMLACAARSLPRSSALTSPTLTTLSQARWSHV